MEREYRLEVLNVDDANLGTYRFGVCVQVSTPCAVTAWHILNGTAPSTVVPWLRIDDHTDDVFALGMTTAESFVKDWLVRRKLLGWEGLE